MSSQESCVRCLCQVNHRLFAHSLTAFTLDTVALSLTLNSSSHPNSSLSLSPTKHNLTHPPSQVLAEKMGGGGNSSNIRVTSLQNIDLVMALRGMEKLSSERTEVRELVRVLAEAWRARQVGGRVLNVV